MSGFDDAYEEASKELGGTTPEVIEDNSSTEDTTEEKLGDQDTDIKEDKVPEVKAQDKSDELPKSVPYDRFLEVVQQKAALEARLANAADTTSEDALDRLLAAAEEDLDEADPTIPLKRELESVKSRIDAQELREATFNIKKEITSALKADVDSLTDEREVATLIHAHPELTAEKAVKAILDYKNSIVEAANKKRGVEGSTPTKMKPSAPPAITGRRPSENSEPKKWGGWESNYEEALAFLRGT